MRMTKYLAAPDQGTPSMGVMVYDPTRRAVASGRKEREQIYPAPGWAEHRTMNGNLEERNG
jgi:glycerol kinase